MFHQVRSSLKRRARGKGKGVRPRFRLRLCRGSVEMPARPQPPPPAGQPNKAMTRTAMMRGCKLPVRSHAICEQRYRSYAVNKDARLLHARERSAASEQPLPVRALPCARCWWSLSRRPSFRVSLHSQKYAWSQRYQRIGVEAPVTRFEPFPSSRSEVHAVAAFIQLRGTKLRRS